jgi:tetratricopeptide (TPR) repeat protein
VRLDLSQLARLLPLTIGLTPDVLPLRLLRHERGRLLMSLHRYDEAVATYDLILAQKAGDTVAINNRGLALSELARTEEAVAAFETAIAIKPQDFDLCYNRARALFQLGQMDAALESYERVLAVDHNNVPSLIAVGISCARSDAPPTLSPAIAAP